MKQFILSALVALSAIAFSSAQAIPPMLPYTVTMENTGSQFIYYALSQNQWDYTSFLSLTINDLTDRNDVIGTLASNEIKKFVFTPLPKYYKFTQQPSSTYQFTFGHSLTSAKTYINYPWMKVTFNLVTESEPYSWGIADNGKNAQYAVDCHSTGTLTAKCDINSDSVEFKY